MLAASSRRASAKSSNERDSDSFGALEWQVPDPVFTSLVQHLTSHELRFRLPLSCCVWNMR
jgi:hypothetical protein